MNGNGRVETPGMRRRGATLLLAIWAATELLLAVMWARMVDEPPIAAVELALRATVVTLAAMGAVAAWRGWRGVRPVVPVVTLVALVSQILTGARRVAWSEQMSPFEPPITESAIASVMVAGTVVVGLAAWYLVGRDPP